MNKYFTVILYILTHATIWAWLEVEMEGKYGWAVNMPTSCAFGGWTWYHIAMNLIVIMTIGAVTPIQTYHFKHAWEKYIATALLFVFRAAVWFCVEDVMWFVINDHFGIEKYNKQHVYWHADKIWFAGTLLLNWIVLFASIALGAVEYWATKSIRVFIETATAYTFLTCAAVASTFMTYGMQNTIPDKTDCFGQYSILFDNNHSMVTLR